MPLFDPDYPLAPFRSALSSIFSALFFSTVACMLAAAIPASFLDWRGVWEGGIFLLWAGTWIMSGIQLWGMVFMFIHAALLNSLVQKTADPLVALCGIFMNQLLVSTVVLTLVSEPELRSRPLISGGFALFLCCFVLVPLYRAGKEAEVS